MDDHDPRCHARALDGPCTCVELKRYDNFLTNQRTVAKLLELHSPADMLGKCSSCGHNWPCSTVILLEGGTPQTEG